MLKGDSVWLTYFEHRSLHKYTRMAWSNEHDRPSAGEVEVRVGKLKNVKAAGKDEITGEMINGGGDWVVD